MNDPSIHRSTEDPLTITTSVAHAGHRDHRFYGHAVYEELAGRVSLATLAGIGINGRRLDETSAGVLDDIAAVWTIADPRIWPPKVSRLGSCYGGCIEGVVTGLLSMDCRYVGIWRNSPETAQWLVDLHGAVIGFREDDEAVSQTIMTMIASRRFLPGFGVPYRGQDERVPPMLQCLRNRARLELPYVALYRRVGEVIRASRGMEPNIAGLAAAVCLDLGFEVEEIGPILLYLAVHMFIANAHEGARQAPEVLQRLPDTCVRYVGPGPRVSPRAAEAPDERARE